MRLRFKWSSALALIVSLLLQACAVGERTAGPARGKVIRLQTVDQFDRAVIDNGNRNIALSGAARCDVRVVQVAYSSVGVRNEPVELSAGLYVPENCRGPFPLLAEAHGTQADRTRSAAKVGATSNIITFFAAQGYVVVVADYLGLGGSSYPFHPYLHADSEASAIVDAIRAAKGAVSTLNVPMSDKVMLFGYSQGGHAAMAAQKEIEQHHGAEISLAASAPMAGPYFLSQTFLGSWFGQTAGEENVLASELLSYTLVSYRKIYADVCPELKDCFAQTYADIVTPLFPSSRELFEIRKQNVLPPGNQLSDLRNPVFTATFLMDAHEPFRRALARNDLLDWTPKTPMVLCGSRRDAVVQFNNSYAAQAAFAARGVEVPVIDIADEVPENASGLEHHTRYGASLCYAAARARLFDPIRDVDLRSR